MSDRLIEWNGKTYDLDASELTMGEYEDIAKRGGPDGLYEMLDGLKGMKPTAWKSLFWIQDRRTDPDLSFGDYAGPTYRLIIDGSNKLPEPAAADPGKAPSETDGSEPSPTPSDTPPPSSTS